MNRNYDRSPRFNAAGLATGCILALVVAMALAVFLDLQPTEASTPTSSAFAGSGARIV